ncbi:probable methyltransferase-like protein 25 isoform X2 [Ptychodera flava]|uniref:probable methyltransferase-like protein 25 isoform X2 n=1 Tax=Ptychodera flava TaxID=63121 RepID=UPI00396AAFA4
MAKRDKNIRLSELKRHLGDIHSFLRSHQILGNVNTVGFFTENQWSLVPNDIQRELLTLRDAELSLLAVDRHREHEGNCWKEACTIAQTTESVAGDIGARHQATPQPLPLSSRFVVSEEAPSDLCEFVCAAKRLCLTHSDLKHLTGSVESDVQRNVNVVTERGGPVDFGMKNKKFHEVTLMSNIITALCRLYGIKQVIDVGSGKGYLSENLALQHGLHVLGIDSSESNKSGALLRNRKLQKFWPGLQRAGKRSERTGSESVCNDKPLSASVDGVSVRSGRKECDVRISKSRECTDIVCASCVKPVPVKVGEEHCAEANGKKVQQTGATFCEPNGTACERAEVTVASFADPNFSDNDSEESQNVNQETLVSRDFSQQLQIDDKDAKKKFPKVSEIKSYQPVTAFVDTDTELSTLYTVNAGKPSETGEETEPLLLTGLHTCGDLAPSILRLFTKNQSAKVLCNVGCCYNLLTEEFEDDTEVSDTEFGFPMSDVLRQMKAKIGRGARMLACSSVDRSAAEGRLPSKSLYYRAVLQVIIEEHYEKLSSDQRVGRMAAKCKTFLEYVRKALRKLQLDDTKLSDEDIISYDEKYSSDRRKLECFVQYRTILAPVIESYLLLDRLCYLLQQSGPEVTFQQ